MKNCEENSKQKVKKCTKIDVNAALMIDFQQLYCNGGYSKIIWNRNILGK